MEKVLISLPDDLVRRMRVVIPNRQRSKVVAALLEKEVEQRDDHSSYLAEETLPAFLFVTFSQIYPAINRDHT
jgi:metal-responsive CopG/Arc/MetJ family transcriptional regulator